MNRRTFLKLLGVGGAAALSPTVFVKPDVRGWRFGAWELQYRYGENYWARCDCGAEQTVGLDKLLGDRRIVMRSCTAPWVLLH